MSTPETAPPMPEQQTPDQTQIPAQEQEQSRFEAMNERLSRVGHQIGNLYLRGRIKISEVVSGTSESELSDMLSDAPESRFNKIIDRLTTRGRLDAAASTMEKMDHKEAFYDHTGLEAEEKINGTTPSRSVVHRSVAGKAPKPRTYPEKRRAKKIYQATEDAHQTKKKYYKMGGQNELFYNVPKSPDKKRPSISPKRRETTREKLKRTTNYQEGMKDKLVSKEPHYESKYHKKLRRAAIRSERKRIKSVEQPVLSRWRVGSERQARKGIDNITSRRGRAVRRIKTNKERLEKSAAKRESLRRELEQRLAESED